VGSRRLPRVALLAGRVALCITALVAVLFVPGDIDSTCTPRRAVRLLARRGSRCVSVNDALYLGTFTRAAG
jgi:hypothetical protein